MRIPTGPDSVVELGELAALVARMVLPVRLDDRLAALEAEVMALRARLDPPGLQDSHPVG